MTRLTLGPLLALALFCVSLAVPRPAGATAVRPEELVDLSLEDLAQVEVTSVSRRPQRQITAPAAIFVITADDIRRAGITSLPEALRLAPGVEVARISSNQWAIGIRGFGSRLARSTLVLIDGRSVYNPLFAGTYWELQDVLLDDIERIEVVRGPGGAMWGANAVNGVINIVTRAARDTQGLFAAAGGGTEERAFASVRYGGRAGETLHYRVYGQGHWRDAGGAVMGSTAFDEWRTARTGARVDWAPRPADQITMRGDYYLAELGQRVAVTTLDPPGSSVILGDTEAWGANAIARWTHEVSETSHTKLQLYYDRTERTDPHFEETRDTVDVDFDHDFTLPRQQVVWGAGYRFSSARTDGVPAIAFIPRERGDHLLSGFVQDELLLVPERLRLVLGTKVEHNEFTGVEVQPTGRIGWSVTEDHLVWTSFSRAVRTPAPIEHDIVVNTLLDPATPTFSRVLGSRDFDSEVVYASELGYRMQASTRVMGAVSLFHNEHRRLLSLERGAPVTEGAPARTVIPMTIGNGFDGRSYGGEVRVDWGVAPWLALHGFYTHLQLDLRRRAGSGDTTTEDSTEGSSPQHQAALRAELELPRGFELAGIARYVSKLEAQRIPAYVNLDVRVGWNGPAGLELSLVGQNLLQARRREFGGMSPASTYVQRGVYGKVAWRW